MQNEFLLVKTLWATAALLVMAAGPAPAEGERPYRHVVLFKFVEDATAEQIREIEKAFAALPSKIDSITGYEWGTNVSPEGLEKGFTHCFLVTFKDKAGLDVYLPHPAHQDFVKLLKPHLEDVLVIDFQGASED